MLSLVQNQKDKTLLKDSFYGSITSFLKEQAKTYLMDTLENLVNIP